MRLVAFSLDGHEFGDDYIVTIKRPYLISPAQLQWSARGGNAFDYYAGIQAGHASVITEVHFKGPDPDWRDNRKVFQGWLANDRKTPKKLIAIDMDDDSAEWSVMVVPETGTLEKGRKSTVVFALVDPHWPFWTKEDPATEHWDVNASPDAFSFTNAGNVPVKPIVTITANVAKKGTFSNKIWRPVYNPTNVPWVNIPYDLCEDTPGTVIFNTLALVSDSSISNLLNGAINAAVLTFNVDTAVGGGLEPGGGMLKVGTEQIYYTDITAGVVTVYDDGAGTTGRGWAGTTAATHADNAVCKQSHIRNDGADFRVMDQNGNFVNFWMADFGTTQTKIFVNVTCPEKTTLVLDEVIANSGAVATIKVKKDGANLISLKALPSNYLILIDDEPFQATAPIIPPAPGLDIITLGTSVDTANYKLINLNRVYARYGETIHSHTKGTTINYVPAYFWIFYGNALADAFEVDDNKKPIINMDESTNLHIIWDGEIKDNLSLRTAQINFGIINTVSKNPVTSKSYSESHIGYVDPAEVAGLRIVNYYFNDRWNVETAEAFIKIYWPAGIEDFDITADKRRTSTSWCKTAQMQKSTNNQDWVELWNEPTPSGTGWETFSTLTAAPGTTIVNRWLRFYVSGSTNAKVSSENDFEIQTLDILAITSRVLKGTMRPVMDNYHFDVVFTNESTQETLAFQAIGAVGEAIVIDCVRGQIYRENDKTKIPPLAGSVFPTVDTGVNDWSFVDKNTVDVSIDFEYNAQNWL